MNMHSQLICKKEGRKKNNNRQVLGILQICSRVEAADTVQNADT